MNRTIKFRAWNGKSMSFPTSNAWFKLVGGIPEVPSGYELMQFTGLFDKNGKEIYEGDIVRRKYTQQNHRPTIVFWREMAHQTGWNVAKGRNGENSLEILGNIYENSDLLV